MKASASVVAGVLLLVMLALYAVLGTQAGGRWLLGQVPGLEVEAYAGRLGGQWQAKRLRWQQGEHWLQAEQPSMAWSPACLARLRVCVERLRVTRLDMDFSAGPPSEAAGPVQLPALALPVAVELADVNIASLRYAGVEQASDLQVAARWAASGIEISSLHARRDALELDVAGTVLPTGAWPLAATVHLQLPPVSGQPWQLALQAKGELQGDLALQGTSEGYLAATLQGHVAPLAEHLPARVQINAEPFLASPELPPTLRLDGLKLVAEGDLQAGYQLEGQASLPALHGDVGAMLSGRVTATGARIDTLRLDAGNHQQVVLRGTLGWQDGLAADASLDWQAFPWQRLYPDVAEPPVALETLKLQANYRNGNYLGNLDAAFKGPAGPFTLVTPFSGDLRQVFLPQLELKAGQGEARGQLQVGFADGVSWKAALALARLDPAYWVAELPGRLGGTLATQGQWQGGTLGLSTTLALDGQLRGQPAVLRADADGQGEHWRVAALDLRLGANRIQGQGQLDTTLKGQLHIALPRLGQLWPGLEGQAAGQLDLAGSLKAPQGQLQLNGTQLGYQQARVQALNLRATLDAGQRGQLALTANGLRHGNTAFGTLSVQGQGDRQRHMLAAKLDGPTLLVDLGLEGGWNNGDWKGRLARGELRAGGQAWQLQAPAPLQRLANGQLDIGAHCWRDGAASLCGEDQRLAPQPRLRYHLKGLRLEGLAPWLPADFAWEGVLNADIAVDLPSGGPTGHVSLDASNGTVRVRDGQQRWVAFPYRTLQVESQLAPRQVDTRLRFDGEQLGSLQANAQIDPLGLNKPLVGQFRLQGLQLAIARPFLPQVDTLKGQLDGSGQLGGDLQAPTVAGQIRLSGGEVAGEQLPMNMKNLQLTAQIAGQQAKLDGRWNSGAQGSATLGGQVSWGDGLDVDLALRGDRLPLTVEPYANLEVAPDLHLSFAGERLAVAGTVRVPRGAITVRQLPPSTVKVSSDTQIVGQQTAQGQPAMAMAMDVDVEVGQDKLTFDGFGLQAKLAGHVHVGDNLDTRGELVLNEGRYRAYGQRLTLRRARLLFAGPIDQPYLDIEAIRQTDDVIAGIRLSGSAEQPSTEVFSEPSMSQEQALSYLVLGRPLSTTGEDNNVLAQAALGLGLMGSSGTAGELARSLGIQDFQLDTEGSGDKTNVVASGNLSERLSLRYGVGVFEPANTIALRYSLSKRLYVEIASGLASSLDLFYKRDF